MKTVVSVLFGIVVGVGIAIVAMPVGLSQSNIALARELPKIQETDYQKVLIGKRLFLDLSQYPKTDCNADGVVCGMPQDEEETCAGFTFLNDGETVLWHGAIDPLCSNEVAHKMRIKWLDNQTFVLIDKNQNEETQCPPRNNIYRVISADNKKVVLEEVWTGWNDFPNEKHTYVVENKIVQ